MKIIFKFFLLQIVIGTSFSGIMAQYKLSTEQLKDGLFYLKKNGGFKNPSSVKFNDASVSTFNFKKECFTWARYDISAQNGFGGFVRDYFFVYFFDGKPFTCLPQGDYPAYIMASNSDGAADYLINLATIDYLGTPALQSKYCPGELEREKLLEETKRIEKENKQNQDKTKFIEIEDKIKAKKIKEAWDLYNKLNFPSSFPKIDFLKSETEIFDNEILSICETFILENRYSDLHLEIKKIIIPEHFKIDASKWKKLPEDELIKIYNQSSGIIKSRFESFLSGYLSEKYKNNIETISEVESKAFIENNKNILKNLSIGLHEVLIQNDGKLFLDDKLIQEKSGEYNKDDYKYQTYQKAFFGINVKINSKMTLNVTESKVLIDKTEKLVVNSKKQLYVKPNGKIYLGNFMNTSYNHENVAYYTSEQMRTNNPNFPLHSPSKGNFAIAQMEKSTIFINKIEVGLKTNEVIVREEKMTKRIPKIIWRSISIVFWTGVTYVVTSIAAQ
jgi:hypothetical protein